jgi:hypothetical protein
MAETRGKRGLRPLTGRVASVNIIGGKLVLVAPWVEYPKRLIHVSVFPEDVQMVQEGLAALVKGEQEFAKARQPKPTPTPEERAAKKARWHARRAKGPLGIKIVDVDDD